MSLKTQINGYTAWINLRLVPYGSLLNNVLTDLLKGNHLQQLLHSLTGKSSKKIQSLDGLTQQQKVTRVEWFIDELKKSEVLPDNVKIDARLVAQKVALHVFDLLWRLVSHDIWFTWERMEFLQIDDAKTLVEIPFQWTPEPPPKKKKRKVRKTDDSLFAGFGASSVNVEEVSPSPEDMEGYDPYPGCEKMKNFKSHRPKGGWYSYPSPDDCILDMINSQLKRVSEGRKLEILSLDDLVESRVLCGLVNSFVPDTFTTEVMLNDRWTINLALDTIGKMLRASNPLGSEDISEADPKALSAFLCFFFMCSYKYYQSKAVISRLKELKLLIREEESEIKKFPEEISSMQDLRRKQQLETLLEENREEQDAINDKYDLEYINDWLEYVQQIQQETRNTISEKMRTRFDLVHIPSHMTINELCLALVINLQLTQGNGFYRAYEHESCTPDRRIVLRDKKSKDFLDDFTGAPGSKNVRSILGLPVDEMIMLEPEKYHNKYEIYIESMSRNKTLHAGSTFLYQVFPGNSTQWQRMFFKAVKEGDKAIVEKMVVFFEKSHPNFISATDSHYGNTVLHVAAKFGHFDICRFLLQKGCGVNLKNLSGCTALFFASEGLHKSVCKLLIEWGCNVNAKNARCQRAFDIMRNEEMRLSLEETGQNWIAAVPEIADGNTDTLSRIAKDHMLGIDEMADLEARCVLGSTLLHTAVHFSHIETIERLLKLRVDVNLKDYQGAVPLHRARTLDVVQLLLESNAVIESVDNEGNTALHVFCYGEEGKRSFLEGISHLLNEGADLLCRNLRKLMPIHCASMQGRQDVIQLLLDTDEGSLRTQIGKEEKGPPSLPYLAVAGDHLGCAKWLIENGFLFKAGEADRILYKVLTQQLLVDDRAAVTQLLLDNGASTTLTYEGGEKCLHLAVQMSGPTDVLEILLEAGAKVDSVNDCKETPFFHAARNQNFYAASLLLESGASIKAKNISGLTPLDYISDFDEWISCEYFSDEIISRLKAFQLKHEREFVRLISKKIQTEAKPAKRLARMRDEELGAQLAKNPSMISQRVLEHFRARMKLSTPDCSLSRPDTVNDFIARPHFISRNFPEPAPHDRIFGTASTHRRSPTPRSLIRVKITRSLSLPPIVQNSSNF